ncbi:MAG TPA: SCO family protein [Polyangiaceae bacterium]
MRTASTRRARAMPLGALALGFLAVLLACVFGGCRSREADLPKYGSVSPFEFLDQSGKSYSSTQLQGTAWVGAFFFTRCPTICPKITARMQALQRYGTERHIDFKLVSFSIDPDFDTPTVLDQYARRYAVDSERWRLLTGNSDRMKQLSEGTFRLAMSGRPNPNADHLGMIHSGHLVLVDREGILRGYYRSSDDDAMQKLERDLARIAQ